MTIIIIIIINKDNEYEQIIYPYNHGKSHILLPFDNILK